MDESQRVVNFVIKSNWFILIAGTLLALVINVSNEFVFGIIAGGIIVVINFQLLKKTLFKTFCPEVVQQKGRSLLGITLIKYYLRFTVSGGIIYLLISKHIVHPLGLLAGLSVIVASMLIATMLELIRLIFKEAV